MASSKETYCLCGQPYNIGQFMIECDCCREWFHGSCVDVKIYQSDDIDKYHCPKCSQTYGPSVLKIRTNNHRADRYELGAESKSAQIGSPAWVRALAARAMRPVPAALQRMRAYQFTEEFVRDNEFTRPILFNTPEGLDMQMPNPATFTVRSVLRYCGAQLEVEVIDVRRQSTLRMPLGDFVDYFETPPEQRDEKVLNVLSLEFSDTSMARLVEPPAMARRLDWAERVWPSAERPPRPAVQRYCLISAAGSYTDFHVDFGGTTVWYHVLHGRKIFYLIPPTAANLALYQQWSASNQHNEKFFGDLVEWYGTAELLPGQTLFIPTGWIHAVLTPEDSLVFGGNFLHSYAIEMQLQIYEIERKVETPIMFRYPLFESMHWYAGAHLLTLLRRHNEESQDEDFIINESQHKYPAPDLPSLLVRGIKILTNALKEWHALKSTDTQKRDNIPKCLNSVQLVRELCRELRTLEKKTTSSSSKDKDYKPKNHSPSKSHSKKHSSQNTKKSLKLTLPKPIMHMTLNSEFKDEKHNKDIYQETKVYNDKDIVYQNDRGYTTQDVKTYNGVQEKVYIDSKEGILSDKGYTYAYEDQYDHETNGYIDRHGKKSGSVLRIKLDNSPSSSRDEMAPPPYSLPEHSILKSHLIGRPVHSITDRQPTLKPIHQWTISKKDIIGDCQEEQILFTNDNLQPNVRIDNQELNYGPGMYSAEDIQPDYQYSETAKPGSYQPDYSNYQNNIQTQEMSISYVDPNGYVQTRQREVYNVYEHKFEIGAVVSQELGVVNTVNQVNTGYINTIQETVNGSYHELPSYDTAIAQQYGATGYVIEDQKTKTSDPPTPVRRSERPVRRRVSPTYDYEDGDLYIDEAPAPARRRRSAPSKHKQYKQTPMPSVTPVTPNNYRHPVSRPAPANGIESLIQASVLAEEPAHSTEDAAVAGMLSISERYSATQQTINQRTFGLASSNTQSESNTTREESNTNSPSKRSRKRTVPSSPEDHIDDEEDVIKEVHRDEEYVYPSLEMSSDEDDDWPPATRRTRSNRHQRNDTKSKSDRDESWSPRARLGRLVPRLRGPARAGVRRECVRAALQAAASTPPTPAAPPHVRHADLQNAKRAVLATKSRRPPPPAHPAPLNKNTRLKKGMKTAKQRLGKILKLHKMMY